MTDPLISKIPVMINHRGMNVFPVSQLEPIFKLPMTMILTENTVVIQQSSIQNIHPFRTWVSI